VPEALWVDDANEAVTVAAAITATQMACMRKQYLNVRCTERFADSSPILPPTFSFLLLRMNFSVELGAWLQKWEATKAKKYIYPTVQERWRAVATFGPDVGFDQVIKSCASQEALFSMIVDRLSPVSVTANKLDKPAMDRHVILIAVAFDLLLELLQPPSERSPSLQSAQDDLLRAMTKPLQNAGLFWHALIAQLPLLISGPGPMLRDSVFIMSDALEDFAAVVLSLGLVRAQFAVLYARGCVASTVPDFLCGAYTLQRSKFGGLGHFRRFVDNGFLTVEARNGGAFYYQQLEDLVKEARTGCGTCDGFFDGVSVTADGTQKMLFEIVGDVLGLAGIASKRMWDLFLTLTASSTLRVLPWFRLACRRAVRWLARHALDVDDTEAVCAAKMAAWSAPGCQRALQSYGFSGRLQVLAPSYFSIMLRLKSGILVCVVSSCRVTAALGHGPMPVVLLQRPRGCFPQRTQVAYSATSCGALRRAGMGQMWTRWMSGTWLFCVKLWCDNLPCLAH